MTIAIRAYDPSDLPALLDLWVASWSEVYDQIDFEARRPWFSQHVADWLHEGGHCRVASVDNALAGFIMIRTSDGLLDQICVAVRHKGDGTAATLLHEARRLSPARVVLAVNKLNRRAIRFYEREGFVRTGEGVNPKSGLPIFHYQWSPD